MGCVFSSHGHGPKQKVGIGGNSTIQDEARSYRSKVGAMRIILKNVHSRRALIKYLEVHHKAEYVKCFQELEEARLSRDDRLFRTDLKRIIANYKSVAELAESKHAEPTCIEYALWDCFGPLRHTQIDSTASLQISKYVHIAQDSLLSQICSLFEEFLDSPEYEECKNFTVENQKMVQHPHPKGANGPRGKDSSIQRQQGHEVSGFHGVGLA